ncbi:MAG TPA: DNA-binding protein [Clostridiales bacterium UBA8960]|nr:DNA-binding protein [Clostridiales bacterium UBA8960]
MSISKENARTLITIDKKLKAEAEKKAKSESRSFSNYVVLLIKNDLNKK